jgi:hypothetical protein
VDCSGRRQGWRGRDAIGRARQQRTGASPRERHSSARLHDARLAITFESKKSRPRRTWPHPTGSRSCLPPEQGARRRRAFHCGGTGHTARGVSPHTSTARENFDAARGANARNAPCTARVEERRPKDWLQSFKAGPPPPWSDGTAEPNGRRLNFSHKNCPTKRSNQGPEENEGSAVC